MASAQGHISWVSLSLLPPTPWVLTGPNLHFRLPLNIFKSTENHKHGMNKARSAHKVEVLTSTPHSHAVNTLKFPTSLPFLCCCSCSFPRSCLTLCDPMGCSTHQSSLSFIISRSLLKLMSIESVTPSNHLILCGPLLLPSVFPSIRVFPNESALHVRWPKYWSLSIHPSNEYSGLISFRIDWFDLLAVQGTL